MPSRDLETNIDGDPSGWNRACKSAEANAAKFRKEVAKLENQLKRQQSQMGKSQKSTTMMRGELVTLAAAGAAVTPAFVAAGAGIAAFGALAIPSILGVVKAQKKMEETWSTLSSGQKVSAVGLSNLIDQYKGLAKSLEPGTLQNFNAAVGITSALMPKLAPIAQETSKALLEFQQKLGNALDSKPVADFFNFMKTSAAPSIGAVTDTSMALVGAVGSLVQALAPLAVSGLGLVSMFANLVGAITTVSPELAQLAVLAVALKSPMSGLAGFMAGFGAKSKVAAKEVSGASKAAKGLNTVAALGPGLYIAAGVALAFLAVKALTAETRTDKLVATMRALNQATGNNVKGYLAMNQALDAQLAPSTARAAQAQAAMGKNLSFTSLEVYKGASAARALTKEWTDAAKTDNVKALSNIQAGAAALGKQYGVTSGQAIALADAIGVNLSKGILDNGQITATTAARFSGYIAAVEAARNPTAMISLAWQNASNNALALKDRVTALTSALDALFNPSIAVYNAQTQMKEAFNTAAEAIKKSKGSLDTHNAASLAARSAFASAASAVSTTAQAVYTYTSRTQGAAVATNAAKQAILAQLPELTRLAGSNRTAQAQVAALAASFGINGRQAAAAGVKVQGLITAINRLQNKTITITYIQRGDGSSPRNPGTSRSFHASGGMVRGPGSGTSDSVPAMLSNREYVVNARSTAKYLPALKAMNAGRYAGGGMVGGYASGGKVAPAVPMSNVPLGDFVSRFMGQTSTKTQVKAAVKSRKDQVDQLRRAERKLAEDRRKHRSARTIADDEARVRKERRDLAAATDKLRATEKAYKKTKLSPVVQLQRGLALGIKNTGAFIKNITKIADMGAGALAQQLLAMGGPEAEKFAAAAAKLSKSKLAGMNKSVVKAQAQQTTLDQLPNILKIKEARKAGAKSVAAMMLRTGLSEQEIAAANEVGHLFARGGIQRYARGGARGPGVASGPTALFGEGRGPEAFVPYDPAYRGRAMGLVSKMASDFGMTRRVRAGASAGAGGGSIQHTTNHITVQGALDPVAVGREIEKVLTKLQRNNGRTTLAFARR